MSFTYDGDGLLLTAGAATLTPDVDTGLLTAITVGGVDTTLAYTAFTELDQLTYTFGAATLLDLDYTHDALARITSKTETTGGATQTTDYGYDLADRLETVTVGGVLMATYQYDENGNRTAVITPGGTTTATYDDQDRLLSYVVGPLRAVSLPGELEN